MSITETSAPTRWYQRRGPRAVVAAAAAVAIAATGVGIAVAANSNLAPERAVAEAVDNLKVLPTGVTITSAAQPGEINLIATDRGVQVGIDSPEAAFDVALIDERVFVRINRADTGDLTGNPAVLGMLALFPSLSAALHGEWVSVDVSEDSPVLAELARLQSDEASDPAAVQTAAAELGVALQAIAEELRGQVGDALTDSAEVTHPEPAPSGPAGSEHYRVDVDGSALRTDLEPSLRAALDDVLTALDAFLSETGGELPQGLYDWDQARAELRKGFDEAMGEQLGDGSADVWIRDGEFSQITVGDVTFAFDPQPAHADLSGAVSMDDDLLRLLPWISQLQSGGFAGL